MQGSADLKPDCSVFGRNDRHRRPDPGFLHLAPYWGDVERACAISKSGLASFASSALDSCCSQLALINGKIGKAFRKLLQCTDIVPQVRLARNVSARRRYDVTPIAFYFETVVLVAWYMRVWWISKIVVLSTIEPTGFDAVPCFQNLPVFGQQRSKFGLALWPIDIADDDPRNPSGRKSRC